MWKWTRNSASLLGLALVLVPVASLPIAAQEVIFEDGFEADNDPQPPQFLSSPVTQAQVGELYQYDVDATDPNGDQVLYGFLTTPPDGMDIDDATGLIEWTPASPGAFDVTVVAFDGALWSEQQFTITVVANQPPKITTSPLTDGSVGELFSYDVHAFDPESDTVSYQLTTAPPGMSIDGASGEIEWLPAAAGDFPVVVQAAANGGTDEQSWSVHILAGPPPAPVAHPLDPHVGTRFPDNIAFLYDGPDRIQIGVEENAIKAHQAAVVRGIVTDRDGTPLVGAKVSALRDEPIGYTLTRPDGAWDLVVNGGGEVVIEVEKAGYLTAQRNPQVPWNDFRTLEPIRLVPLSPLVTTIDLDSTEGGVARGAVESDVDGSRQGTLFFQPGTEAALHFPGGGSQPISTLDVRITEFTVGPNGQEAMPAFLPPTSGYTYAAEYSVDEAIAKGAERVSFDPPAVSYLENFVGFPVGVAVPLGSYNRSSGVWEASPDGLVIEIVAINAGLAELDLDGDGLADDGLDLGITEAERAELAQLYSVGQQLWRVEVPHFSPWDPNYPYGNYIPLDAEYPRPEHGPRGHGPDPDKDCESKGFSTVDCQSQVLREAIPVAGTDQALHYRSDRAEGFAARHTVQIAIPADDIPDSAADVILTLQVAGQKYEQVFSAQFDIDTQFSWDGDDAYGRPVYGAQPYELVVGFRYPAVYRQASAAGGGGTGGGRGFSFLRQPSGTSFELDRDNLWYVLKRTFRGQLSFRSPDTAALGGWTLTEHHAYEPASYTLALGDGQVYGAANGVEMAVVRTPYRCIPPSSCPNEPVEGALVTSRNVRAQSATPLSDGSIIFTNFPQSATPRSIWRIRPDGILNGVSQQDGLKLTPLPNDDVLLVQNEAGTNNSVVFRLALDGNFTRVFGGGSVPLHSNLDYVGPATGLVVQENQGYRVNSLAAAPDGSFYVAVYASSEGGRVTIWHVGPEGTAQRVAGQYTGGETATTATAADAEIFDAQGLAVSPEGDLWVSERRMHRVRRISEGVVQPAIGTGLCATRWVDEGPALATNLCLPGLLALAPNGLLYIASYAGTSGIQPRRLFRYDGEEFRLVAGGAAVGGSTRSGEFALGGRIGNDASSLFVNPNGSILIQEPTGVYATIIIPPLFEDAGIGNDSISLPSQDGRYLFEFDADGRHQQTVDTFLKTPVRTFSYDPGGRLVSMEDVDGRVTTITRDGSGVATSITGPDGHVTTLGMVGDTLSSITNPAAESWNFAYAPDGLLTSATDPRGHASTYVYGSLGYLEQATNRGGGVMTLARTVLGVNAYEVAITTRGSETRIHRVEQEGTSLKRTLIDPTGATTVVTARADGTTTGVFPDGSSTTYRMNPDPRFGGRAGYVSQVTSGTPGGKFAQLTISAEATLANLTDPESMTQWTETHILDGKTSTFVYDVAARTLTRTSPEGRVVTQSYDPAGRLLSLAPGGGLSPVNYSYSPNGRLATINHGSETLTLGYDGLGHQVSVTDQDSGVTSWVRDSVGRMESVELPSGRSWNFTLDDNGNRTAIQTPDMQVHALTYDNNNLVSSFTAPGSAPLVLQYDGLGRREGVIYPDTTQRDDQFVNDLLAASVLPESALSLGRLPEAGGGPGTARNISFLARDPDSQPQQSLTRSLDGPLVTGETQAGPAASAVAFTYLTPYQVSSRTFESESPVVFDYDDDGLRIAAGPFDVTRAAATGLQEIVSDGTLELATTFDSRAQLASKTLDHGVTTRYQMTLTRDARSRISNTVTDVDGSVTERNFEYDADGQLVAVTDGADNPVESFVYDGNGNRTSHTIFGDVRNASYDDQDRIDVRDAVPYAYDDNGFLSARGADTFSYTADGALTAVTVAGTSVTYDHDYYGRRVARTDSGGTTTWSYGDLDQPFRVTASIAPDNTVSEYYHDDAGHLYALQRGGAWYYVGTDAVGSPVVVVDAASGSVIRSIAYSAFGEVLADSNPGFVLPVGFAGGLPDPETDLVRFGLRDYEPVAGRFTARDPILHAGGSPNLYAYVLNDPINYRDLTGLFLKIGGSAYAGLGGGLSVTISSQGIGICGELGAGVGGGIGFEPFSDLPEGGISAVGSVGFGPFGGSVEVPFNDCWASGRPQFNYDGFGVTSETVNDAVDNQYNDFFKSATEKGRGLFKNLVKGEASLSIRACTPPLTF